MHNHGLRPEDSNREWLFFIQPPRQRSEPEPVANVRVFSLAPRTFTTRRGGLFLFVADLVRL
jgi:hypothetical protein